MPDNTYTIGAIVDTAELGAGMNMSADMVKESIDKMMVSFQEASPAAARAVARISEDTKAAAVEVDASWQQVARATLGYTAALKEVSAASYLARRAGEDDAAAMNVLAAAKQRAAAAAAELATANKAVAASEEEESGLAAITGALEGMWSALTEVAAAALVVYTSLHRLTEASDFAIQMRNLSEVTGISAASLAGLHDVTEKMGVDFDAVSTALAKMEKSQQDAIDGNKAQILGFHLLGISINELKTLSPEELFYRVAAGFQSVGSSAAKNTAAVDIFGRGGRALIPVFESSGSALKGWVAEAAAASGVTEENTEASLEYKALTEELSVALRAMALDVLPTLVKIMDLAAVSLEAAGAGFKTLWYVIAAFAESSVTALVGFSKVMMDDATWNFSAAVRDGAEAKNKIEADWVGAAKNIKDAWTSVAQTYLDVSSKPKIPSLPKAKGEDLPDADQSVKDERMTEWRLELDQKRDAEAAYHELSKADEAAFWQSKLALAKGNLKLYAEVYHNMREAERAEEQKSLQDEAAATSERVAATKQGSAERVAILTEEVAHLKAIGADQTSEYKRMQTELAGAERDYAQQSAKTALEAEQKKAEAAKKGSADSVAAWAAFVSKAKQLYGEDSDEYRAAVLRKETADREYGDARDRIAAISDESDVAHAASEMAEKRQQLDALEQLGLVSARRKIEMELQLLDEEYAGEAAALARKIALYDKDSEEYARLVAEKRKLDDKYHLERAQLDTQAAKESMKSYDQFFQHVSQGFSSAIGSWMEGTKTFGKSMAQLWNSIVVDFVESLAKMMVAWVEHHIQKLIVHQVENEGEVASDASATAQKDQISLISSLKRIGHDAAAAAAHAFESVMGAVPFPLNLVLAPVAAAAAFAGVMAFESLASARDGMVSGAEQLALIHKNEMVLPAPLSQGFQSIIGRMGGAIEPAAAPAGAPAAAANVTNHHHYNSVVNVNGADKEEVLEHIRDNFAPMMRQAQRRGALPAI
jgi:hypothetical protein